MAKCRSCGAEIIWIKTTAGKLMPCNPIGVHYWAKPKARGKVITQGGEVLSCLFEGDEYDQVMEQETKIGFIPHFSTCPVVKNQKKGKNGQRI